MTESKKRPALVWIISIFYYAGTAFAALVYARRVPLSFEEAFYRDASRVDLVLTVLLALANIAAATLLLQLRRHALHLFLAAVALRFLMFVTHTSAHGLFAHTDVGALLGSLGLPLIVCAYTWRQVRTGLLT